MFSEFDKTPLSGESILSIPESKLFDAGSQFGGIEKSSI